MMDKSKYGNSLFSRVVSFLNKILVCIIIFLGLAIACKSNNVYKEKIYYYLYQTNIDFTTFKNIYNKYLGGIFPLEVKEDDTSYVFFEQIKYNSISDYGDGVILEVGESYLVPNLDSGVVIYIGDKEFYGNTVIVENSDGINILYGNICNSNLKLYDNIDSSTYVGEACDDYIYLVFSNGDTYLDYSDYIG